MKVTREQALAAKAWPFEEARKLLARVESRKKAGQAVDCPATLRAVFQPLEAY